MMLAFRWIVLLLAIAWLVRSTVHFTAAVTVSDYKGTAELRRLISTGPSKKATNDVGWQMAYMIAAVAAILWCAA